MNFLQLVPAAPHFDDMEKARHAKLLHLASAALFFGSAFLILFNVWGKSNGSLMCSPNSILKSMRQGRSGNRETDRRIPRWQDLGPERGGAGDHVLLYLADRGKCRTRMRIIWI